MLKSEYTNQNCSYQGEALNVPTAFKGLWSSNNIKKINVIKQNENNFFSKIWNFLWKSSPHTPYKVQKDKFCSL